MHIIGDNMYTKSKIEGLLLMFSASEIQQVMYSRCPDDDTFMYMSRVFSLSHHKMATPGLCGDDFNQGITNGAMWYPVAGKWFNVYLTLMVSCGILSLVSGLMSASHSCGNRSLVSGSMSTLMVPVSCGIMSLYLVYRFKILSLYICCVKKSFREIKYFSWYILKVKI